MINPALRIPSTALRKETKTRNRFFDLSGYLRACAMRKFCRGTLLASTLKDELPQEIIIFFVKKHFLSWKQILGVGVSANWEACSETVVIFFRNMRCLGCSDRR